MELLQILQRQDSLQKSFMEALKASNVRQKAQHMRLFLDDARCLLAYSSFTDVQNDGQHTAIHEIVIRMASFAVAELTKISRSDLDEENAIQYVDVVMQLLMLLRSLKTDASAKSQTTIIGIAHIWRLLFCQSDSTLDTTADALRLRSTQVKDILYIVASVYLEPKASKSRVQLCYIMLEIFRLTDVNQHISMILDTLATVPADVNLLQIYPGLVSRVVVNLSKLRESDFGKAIKVLDAWIHKVIVSATTKHKKQEESPMIRKTSEAVTHILKKYWEPYWQHLTGLCATIMKCQGLPLQALDCIYSCFIKLIRQEGSWQALRKLITNAPSNVKIGFWRLVSHCISSKEPEALMIYLGYIDLQSHVSGLEELDEYSTMELIYQAVDIQVIDSSNGNGTLRWMSLSEEEPSMDLCQFTAVHDELLTKVAASHIRRMEPIKQQQTMDTLLNYLICNRPDDGATLARLLAVLHGFLSTGVPALSDHVVESIDAIMVKVIKHGARNKLVELCTLLALSVAFEKYTPAVPQQQICDILFWLLPLCVSGNEKSVNNGRMVISNISTHHMRTVGVEDGKLGVKPLLGYYKNLLVSRCIREIRYGDRKAEPVAKVLYVLLSYKQLEVKDIFDISLELERCNKSQETTGRMPTLNRTSSPTVDADIFALYCYAFIARYIDHRFADLLDTTNNIPVNSLLPSGRSEMPLELEESTKRHQMDNNSNDNKGTDSNGTMDQINKKEEMLYGDDESLEMSEMKDPSGELTFKDKRLSVATLIATRCRYYLCDGSTEARNVALYALHKCTSAFCHNVPLLRIRLYEYWDPVFLCMEQNMRNLRIMTSIFGIFTLGIKHCYSFVERWMVDIFEKLIEMLMEECKVNNVTVADEANRTIRFKFSVAILDFLQQISLRVTNRELFSKVLLVALLMCRSTAPRLEAMVTNVFANLYHKNPPLVRNVLIHAGLDHPASVALLRFAVKRDLSNLMPKGARLRCLLPLLSDVYSDEIK